MKLCKYFGVPKDASTKKFPNKFLADRKIITPVYDILYIRANIEALTKPGFG